MIADFDPYRAAGDYGLYSVVYRFRVRVVDGALNIRLVPVSGKSHLAALSVTLAQANSIPPAIPQSVQATPSYEGAILDWDDNLESDLGGFHIYRSKDSAGPYQRITSNPLRQSRYIDQFKDPTYLYSSDAISLPSEQIWVYQVTAVTLDNQESERSTPVAVQPLAVARAGLPVFQMEISEDHWQYLNKAVNAKEYVSAKLKYQGETYNVNVRYRGNFTLNYAKKSWKIVFTDETPFPGRHTLNLKSHYDDVTLIRGPLTMKLYEKMGVPAPKTQHALFFVNGTYHGVYTDYEQIDEEYLERTQQESDVLIYETLYSDHSYGISLGSLDSYDKAYDLKTNKHIGYGPLIEFIENVATTPEQFFSRSLNNAFDVSTYLKYYAGIIFTSNLDFTHHNVFLNYAPQQSLWSIVAWDPDYTWGLQSPFGHSYFTTLPIDAGSRTNSGTYNGPNYLLSRMIQRPEYRTQFCSDLAQITTPLFIENDIYPLIDAYHNSIQAAVHADWHKYEWENSTNFDLSVSKLKQYATSRAQFLRQEMDTFCPTREALIKVNEVAGGAQSQICDPDESVFTSCFDQWFELYNPGLEPFDLKGMYLTNDLNNPTKYRIDESLIISTTGYTLIWADGEPVQGANHTSFSITPETQVIALFGADGQTLIDKLTLTERGFNVTEGKFPDGANQFYQLARGTPGEPNRLATTINHVYTDPQMPLANEEISVLLNLFPDTEYQAGFLHYTLPTGQTNSAPLTRKAPGLYSASVPAQPDKSLIKYHLEVQSSGGTIEVSPANAPTQRYEFLVGYQRPSISINEIQALHGNQGQQPLQGSFSWLELYNSGNTPIDLAGMYLTDDSRNRTKYLINGPMIVPARGYTVFYANNTPELSYWHTNFILRQKEGEVYLYDSDENENQLVTSYSYKDAPSSGTLQVCVNQPSIWSFTFLPTPGYANTPECKLVFMPMINQ